MTRTTKIWLLAAAGAILLSGLLFAGVMTACGWDFRRLSTVNFETNTHAVTDAFREIDVRVDTAAVEFLPAADGACRVVCFEDEKARHTVRVEDGKLTVEVNNARRWWEHFNFTLTTPKLTVYLPKEAYGALTVETDVGAVSLPQGISFASLQMHSDTGALTGSTAVSGRLEVRVGTGAIRLTGLTAGELSVQTDTGAVLLENAKIGGTAWVQTDVGGIRLRDCTCTDLVAQSDVGAVALENVVADGDMTVKTDTGAIRFDRSDAATLSARSDTGSIRGSLRSEKVFLTKTGTGRVRVPQTTAGGKCTLQTATGNIEITLAP